MRVALVSYEYPLDTPAGGIATYTRQAARLLKRFGHDVEVFAGSPLRNGELNDDGVTVHLVREKSRYDFSVLVGHRFAERHVQAPFNVVEAPELYAEARKILELVPDIPLVIRMHTPNLRLWKLSCTPRGWKDIASDVWGQIYSFPWYIKRQYRLPDFRFVRPEISFAQYQDVIENDCAASADCVVALFPGMRDFLIHVWQIPAERVIVVPNPFFPSTELLSIPIGTYSNTISFIGRLEVRKGILDWMKAIPWIASRYPDAQFRFVGASSRLEDGTDTAVYLSSHLREYRDRLEFTGAVHPERMAKEFALTGIVVAPSLWENYPYACLEAMAAGRAIVGSTSGGMAEMLAGGAGLLVKPGNPLLLAKTVSRLLENPNLQQVLGTRARKKVLLDHDSLSIVRRMEEVYNSAVAHRKAMGPRMR